MLLQSSFQSANDADHQDALERERLEALRCSRACSRVYVSPSFLLKDLDALRDNIGCDHPLSKGPSLRDRDSPILIPVVAVGLSRILDMTAHRVSQERLQRQLAIKVCLHMAHQGLIDSVTCALTCLITPTHCRLYVKVLVIGCAIFIPPGLTGSSHPMKKSGEPCLSALNDNAFSASARNIFENAVKDAVGEPQLNEPGYGSPSLDVDIKG